MAYRFRTIVHPTDFSDASAEAFSHALRIALAMKGKLLLVHIRDLRYVHERDRFPSVRQALEQWRLLDEDDRPTAVGEKLGIEVETVRLEPQDPVRGLLRFLDTVRDQATIGSKRRERMPSIHRVGESSPAEQASRAALV